MNTTKALTEQHVAELTELSVRTLQKWRLTGEGPVFVKLGRAVRYREEDIDAFLEACARRSTSDLGGQHV